MCTVTYIPQSENHFILTSNRDEAAKRSPQNISFQSKNGVELTFPRDEAAGGTWIAVSNDNRLVCLLNGAFEKHEVKPPYRRSRGLMVLDFFEFPTANHFFGDYTFEGMEPFTMVIYDDGKLYEFRWDGDSQHILSLNPNEKYIWSSSTLYPNEIKALRKNWFNSWLKERQDLSQSAILDFHQNGGCGDAHNDLVMNRDNVVQTVSITSIEKKSDMVSMKYHDLINDAVKVSALELELC